MILLESDGEPLLVMNGEVNPCNMAENKWVSLGL